MQNQKQPNTATMLFRNHAPWEMRKAQDSGCLCKQCKGVHLLRRGVPGACAAIDNIVDRVTLQGSVTRETQSQLDILKKIKDMLTTPSK